MVNINININQISAEKLMKSDKKISGKVKISTNVNIIDVSRGDGGRLSIPFVTSINYNPSIAKITLKGEAIIVGDESELDPIYQSYENKERPPTQLIRQITNNSITEATIISRTLRIPPPIPFPKTRRGKRESDMDERPNYVG